jgi:hypothetical protein
MHTLDAVELVLISDDPKGIIRFSRRQTPRNVGVRYTTRFRAWMNYRVSKIKRAELARRKHAARTKR